MSEPVVATITSVGLVGCGTMGAGIAELVASHGYPVRYVERDDEAVEDAFARIGAALDRNVERGRITHDERDRVAALITGGTNWNELGVCDLVIEALPESLPDKQQAFARIDHFARPDAILATNTSSLPVMDIAVHTSRPNRVLGFHFFNPAPVMTLIELVRTVVSDESVVETARAFAGSIGKIPVVVRDRRGFIVNQLLLPYLNQAVWMVESGYATKDDVDTAMRLGTGIPMGPIALTDLIGIDTFIGIMDAIHGQFTDTRFAPRPLLAQLSAAGFTGRKAGRGFYRYEAPGSGHALADDDIRSPADPAAIAGWRTVGVLGTSGMAPGIIEVCARAGFDVVVRGRSRELAEKAVAQVAMSLQRMVEKSRISADEMVAALARIRATPELDELAACDLVIESAAGDLEVKRELLTGLVPQLGRDAVVSTTTSSSAVIDAAMVTDRPESVIGLHFFHPPEIMRLVEIVTTVRTDPRVVEQARAFVARIDKVGVLCGDRAGFIVNTLLFPYLNDAVKMLSAHYATVDEIDTAMKLGCGHPMGPFEVMDVVGLDTTLAILERLEAEYRQPAFRPASMLRNFVDAGFLGRKAGRGFYVYR